ncbi:Glycoside hydrolase family 76 protein [Mycena sanguinolenta]|uniref:Glycoside hydrolase family 76 protein n=1 Tax=Mycena sanguinolenta TaxID=230812 RepID=A0A8H6XB17_9AGAR|nr:Glycoside hydrolase family 76 protein [Mycena sanguinolenta]
MLPFALLWVLDCALLSGSIAVPTLRARTVVSESAWRKPNITQTLPDLINTASAALVKAVNGASTADQFNGQTYENVATTYSEMAEFDMLTNQTQYEESLQQSFSRTQETRPNFEDTDVTEFLACETYGYAATRAYAAYQNSSFLDFAIQSWSFGRSYTLSQGFTSLPVKNFTLQGSCNGATMVGGTFWTTTVSDPSIAAMSTGYFMLLSALLFEATSNSVYLQAATDSVNFIQSQLYSTSGFVLEQISGSANDTCEILSNDVDSFNSGLLIEGLAVLVAQTHDATMQTSLENLITNVLSNAPWQTTTGIIIKGDDKVVRGLLAAYMRNVTTPTVHQNLRDYLAVQFNAVSDLATNGDDIYAAQWTGPPSSSFSLPNQLSALSALLSAAYVVASDEAAEASSTPSPSGSASSSAASSTSSATSSSTPPAAIAGATIAGVFIIALATVVLVIFRRRAQARRLTAPAPMSTSQPVLSPSGYSLPASYSAPTSNASQPLSDPSFVHPSDLSLPRAPPAHPSAPPTDFSFIPRSYVVAEKGRPLPRHVPQLSQVSGTVITTSTGSSSYGNILSATGADAGSPVHRDSRLPGGAEEPPPILGCALCSESVPTLRARDLVSESSWRKPDVTQSLPDLINLASAALGKAIDGSSIVNQFNGQTYEIVATLYSEMAELDLVTNQTQYEDTLQQSFFKTQEIRPNFSDVECVLSALVNVRLEIPFQVEFRPVGETYGYAALCAYAAYKNSTFLDFAIQSWSFGRSYTLSQASTTLVGKNFTIVGSCNGTTMAGGTFLTTTASDPSVAAMSTGYFMLLSAMLFEATSNPIYLQAATDSAVFIQSQLYTSNGFVLQIISASANDTCKVLDDTVNSFNSGLFIEGLAVLVSQTQNATTQTLLENLITNVLFNGPWNTPTGIIAQGGGKNGDAILVRALATAYLRNVTTPAIRQNLRDYIAVQFNAVVDLATNGDDIYADQWTGPPSSSLSLGNQTSALSPLLSAAHLMASNVTTVGLPSSSPSGSGSTSQTSHRNTATIAGGTVGGVLALVVVFILYRMLRRSARRRALATPAMVSTTQPFFPLPYEPLFAPTSSTKTSSTKSQLRSDNSSSVPHPYAGGKKARHPLPRALPAPIPVQLPPAPDPVHINANPQDLPIAQLVQLLNQRLGNHQWNPQETLPGYRTT